MFDQDDGIAYAHSVTARPRAEWERLDTHLENVADLAGRFADHFGSLEWGCLAGLWHDLGKYRRDFQRRIRGEAIRAPHAGAGAALAYPVAPPLAFAIAGHHSGLANRSAEGETHQTPLQRTVEDNASVLTEVRQLAPAAIVQRSFPSLPEWLQTPGIDRRLRIELWTRFLFSALVDADRLATERFYEPTKRDSVVYAPVSELRARLDAYLNTFEPNTPVNAVRAAVLEQCRRAAALDLGFFSLTVPTGGGKTLSSMSFALRHAERYHLRRVIVVAPYTSIIEQNASVYRSILGADNVIEHHSAVDEDAREDADAEAEVRRRLAIENWDAPIIVTTAVQFFETLFSNEPSRCRKLHNVARSVVIIDEAQTLPTDFLLTTLDAMRQLTSHYGCSIVLSTATQPALNKRDALPQGLQPVREIIDHPSVLSASLRRVAVRWPRKDEITTYTEVARDLSKHAQVLAIVHARRDARTLAELLPENGRYHLSRRMCAAHRLATLAAVKSSLERRDVCRVVSTQLIEAGVDISFPVLYRAMAGLDSLAQAAGRCNRHGELTDESGRPVLGDVVIFRAESEPPRGVLRRGFQVAESMLRGTNSLDLGDPLLLEEYFRGLYLGSQLDRHGIMAEREALNFATVAQRMRLIEPSRPLVVPWGDAEPRIRGFESSLYESPSARRKAARALQPFVVPLFDRELQRLQEHGAVIPLEGFGHVVAPNFEGIYDAVFGLTIDLEIAADPAAMII